jgi:hypothetical protein
MYQLAASGPGFVLKNGRCVHDSWPSRTGDARLFPEYYRL